jgi:hypothetical protein
VSETEAKNARSKAKFNRAKAKAKVKSKAKAKAKSVRRRLSFGAKCLPQTQFESAEAHGVPQAENAPEQLQPAELERHGPCEFQAGNDAEVVQPPSGLPPDRPAEAPVRPRKFELPDEPRPASSSSAAAPSDRKSIFERRPNQHQSPTALQGITPRRHSVIELRLACSNIQFMFCFWLATSLIQILGQKQFLPSSCLLVSWSWTLAGNKHVFTARFTNRLQLGTCSRSFDYKNESSWIAALEDVHAYMWTAWTVYSKKNQGFRMLPKHVC